VSNLGDKSYYVGVHSKSFSSNISRTATSAAELFVLPAHSVIKQVTVIGAVSNAGGIATLSIGSNGGGGKDFLADLNVKTNGVVSYPSSFNAFGGQNDPNPVILTATYAEDGNASTAGGPWTVVVDIF